MKFVVEGEKLKLNIQLDYFTGLYFPRLYSHSKVKWTLLAR